MKRVFALKFPFLKRRCLIMGDENEVQAIAAVLTNYPFFDVVCSGDNHGSMPSFEEAEGPGSLMGPHGIDEIILGETADSSPETRNTLMRFKPEI